MSLAYQLPDVVTKRDYIHSRTLYTVVGITTQWRQIPEQVLDAMDYWHEQQCHPVDEPTARAKFLQMMARYDNQAQAALLTSGLYDA